MDFGYVIYGVIVDYGEVCYVYEFFFCSFFDDVCMIKECKVFVAFLVEIVDEFLVDFVNDLYVAREYFFE